MSKIGAVIVVVLSLVAGFGGGVVSRFIFNQAESTNPPTSTESTSETGTETPTSASIKTQTLEECLTEVWGADKYAAISANSSLATTEDNLAALKCYNN